MRRLIPLLFMFFGIISLANKTDSEKTASNDNCPPCPACEGKGNKYYEVVEKN